MLVGYMCVSTEGELQVLDLQRDALLSATLCSTIMPAAAGAIAPAWQRPWHSSGRAIASSYGSLTA